MIFIDTRERPTTRTRILAACEGDGQVVHLDAADFVIIDADGCSLGIERKSVTDLLNSLAEKAAGYSSKLERQLAQTSAAYTLPCLLVEGGIRMCPEGYVIRPGNRDVTGWRHSAIMGFLYAQRAKGIHVLHTYGLAETADLLRILHQRGRTRCLGTGETLPLSRGA